MSSLARAAALCLALAPLSAATAEEWRESELSYGRFAAEHDPSHPLYCMYGYFASKTGDHETGRRIFERCAAEASSGQAYVYLSLFHEEGLGVPRDPARAEAILREGAAKGYSLAQFNLGAQLLRKAGTEAERAEALGFLRAAAAQGDRDAARLVADAGS